MKKANICEKDLMKELYEAVKNASTDRIDACFKLANENAIDLHKIIEAQDLSDLYSMEDVNYNILLAVCNAQTSNMIKMLEYIIKHNINFSNSSIEQIMHHNLTILEGAELLCRTIFEDNSFVLEYLLDRGVDINFAIMEDDLFLTHNITQNQSLPKLNLLSFADIIGAQDCKTLLLKRGARTPNDEPIRHLISQNKLDELLKQNQDELNLTKLLTDEGYDALLCHRTIVLNTKKINLSDISIYSCKIVIKEESATNFLDCSRAIIKNSVVSIRKNITIESKDSNFENCSIIALSYDIIAQIDNGKNNVLLYTNFSTQSWILRKYENILNQRGVCAGLVMEYARLVVNKPDSHDPLGTKLKNNLLNNNNHFAERIQFYWQTVNSMRSRAIFTTYKISDEIRVIQTTESKVLYISFSTKTAAHAIGIRISGDPSDKKYVIYDPNFGETNPMAIDELVHAMKCIEATYSARSFAFYDIEASIKKYKLSKNSVTNYHKVYTKNIHLLFEAIKKKDEAMCTELAKYIDIEYSALAQSASIKLSESNSNIRLIFYKEMKYPGAFFEKYIRLFGAITEANEEEIIFLSNSGLSNTSTIKIMLYNNIGISDDIVVKLKLKPDDIWQYYQGISKNQPCLKYTTLHYILNKNLITSTQMNDLFTHITDLAYLDQSQQNSIANCFKYNEIKEHMLSSYFGEEIYDFFETSFDNNQKLDLFTSILAKFPQGARYNDEKAYILANIIPSIPEKDMNLIKEKYGAMILEIEARILLSACSNAIKNAAPSKKISDSIVIIFKKHEYCNIATSALATGNIAYETLDDQKIRVEKIEYAVVSLIIKAVGGSIEELKSRWD